MAIAGSKFLPLSGLTADISVSQIVTSLMFIPPGMAEDFDNVHSPCGLYVPKWNLSDLQIPAWIYFSVLAQNIKTTKTKLWNEKEKKKKCLFALHTSSSRDLPNCFLQMQALDFFSEVKLMLAKTAFYNSAEACCFFV